MRYICKKSKIICPRRMIWDVILGMVVLSVTFIAGFAEEQNIVRPAVVEPAKVSLDVKGMDVIDVLKILSDEGKFNLSISGNITGRVTLFLKDIAVWDALEIVLISSNLAYEKNGEIIYVMSDRDYELKYGTKYWDKRKVAVFNFSYAKVARVRELFSQIASSIGKVIIDDPTNTLIVIDIPEKIKEMEEIVKQIDKSLKTEVFQLNYLAAEELEKKVSDVLTKEVGSIKIDAASNKIVVVDYPDKLAGIEKMISAFDEKPLQVLINAKIVELTPSKNFYSGINWEYWMKKYFQTTGTFSSPITTDKITFGTHETSAKQEGKYGGTLQFLQMFGETKVLSTPRILVLNNQEAKILVGTRDAYITSTVSEVGQSAVTSQSVNFIDTGVKLYVTPTINKKGYIILKIKPEISSATSESIKSSGQSTDVPIVTTSEAETSLIVKDGVDIFLGGLRRVTRDKQRKQVPFLGNIPLVGGLFRSNENEWSKNELVIILTPQIVSGDRSIELEIQEKQKQEMWETDAFTEYQKDSELEGKKKFKIEEALPEDEEGIKEQKPEAEETGDLLRSPELDKILKEAEIREKEKLDTLSKKIKPLPADKSFGKKKKKEELTANEKNKTAYYLEILERVNNTALLFNAAEKGKVKLKLTISDDGRLLEEPVVVSLETSAYLADTAKKIIELASPFPSFTGTGSKKETYEIQLTF